MTAAENAPVLVGHDLRKTFRRDTGEVVAALDGISLEVGHGTLTALVGPDGAGKTTLLRLAAGLMTADAGELKVLGVDVAADPQQVQERIGYMPQRFGLYEDLSVQENLNLYADLHGIGAAERREQYPRLLQMTALGPFTSRLAGQLSGGMKQKLGLACTLVRSPELLLLDEPTVGVDPLSRRELWDIIFQLVRDQKLTVLLSTSYLDEAERCEGVVVLHNGKVLAHGRPAEVSNLAAGRTFLAKPPAGQPARRLQARLLDAPGVVDAVPEGGQVRLVQAAEADGQHGSNDPLAGVAIEPVPPRFEDGFMVLLRRTADETRHEEAPVVSNVIPPSASQMPHSPSEAVVQVHDLVRQFGTFTAVDRVSFEVRRGEMFGLLGPNGAGKTTTFRMLCGLLPATSGTLQVAGVDLRHARAEARQRIGYVAQKFSLYGQLTVTENLDFFASAYGLRGRLKRERIGWALQQFELAELARLPSGQLPGGYKQRLAMAAALLHEPEILFLDEPTSGADPLARREFWRRITALCEQGVTAIITTHFMEEAEYCDRVAIMDGGRILAQGTPAEVRRHARPTPGRAPKMEDAFIAVVEEARSGTPHEDQDTERPNQATAPPPPAARRRPHSAFRRARRVWSLVRKEAYQIGRDSSSLAIGVVLPVILIILFGYGLSLDVKNVPVAVVLEDPSPDATELAAAFQLSPYFDAQLLTSMPQAQEIMLARQVDGIVRIRSDFARHLHIGDAEVQVLVNGTDANRARIIQGYAQAAVGQWAARRAAEGYDVSAGPVVVRDRLWFNEANESRYYLVPGLIVLVMTLIGATLTSLVMAREWERGTLEALFVTPVRAEEILLGKTIPYFVLGMAGLALCLLAAKFVFQVPFRGSVWVLTGSSMLYLLVVLSIGLSISSAFRSQFVASQLTMLITFLPAFMLSGFLFNLRSMPAAVRLLTYVLPARYYVALLQTIFLAGDVWRVLVPNAAVLTGMAAALLLLARSDAEETGLNKTWCLMLDAILRILALTRKELLAILKDPRGRSTLFIPPILQCLIYGYVATYDLTDVPYAVLDRDRSAASHDLLARLDGTGVFHRVADLHREADVKSYIDDRRVLLIIQIDQDFERRLLTGQSADVQVIADGRNSNTAATATGYVNVIVEAFNADWQAAHGQPGSPVRVTSRAWYNPNLETRWHMIPSLIGTLTMMQTLLLTALSVAREREQGTFDQLLVTPYRPTEIMAGKALPSMLIGLVQATMILLVAQLWFRIPFVGSFVVLYVGLLFFLLAAVGIGLLVSSVAATMQQAMIFGFVVMMPFVLLSGLTTPISSMPAALQYFTFVNPLRYAIEIVHEVYLEGAGLELLFPQLWPLAAIAFVTLSAASWMFRHRLT